MHSFNNIKALAIILGKFVERPPLSKKRSFSFFIFIHRCLIIKTNIFTKFKKIL